MENIQPSSNQNSAGAENQPRQASSNNKLFLVITTSVLLTAMIAGSAVYLWQRSVNEKTIGSLKQKVVSLEAQISRIRNEEIPTTTQPTAGETGPLDAIDETDSWETYTNAAMGISFRYPSKVAEILMCESGNIFIVPLDRNFDPCQSSGGRFYITADKLNFTLPDWYYRDYSITTESIMFSSTSATKYSGTRISSEPAPIPLSFYMIAVPTDTKTILVNVENYPGSRTLDDDLIDQILSTFKFTD